MAKAVNSYLDRLDLEDTPDRRYSRSGTSVAHRRSAGVSRFLAERASFGRI
jgi:hypothetical protein